jgi:arylsulfatase A-like enzyme
MHPRDRLVYPLGALDARNYRFGENADIADLPKAGRVMARQLYEWHRKYKADKGKWLDAVQAYLAACSCVDNAIGVLLDGLAKGPNASNTIVVVWSDHGFQLGEKLAWLKHTLWERALRIPVVIAGPGVSAGRREDLFSSLDIYPTLCGLAGVDAPPDLDGLDQTAMVRGGAAGGRDVALSAWALDLEDGLSVADGANWREDVHLSGRTKTHRLIRYGNGDLELYDHRHDPWEWRNFAGKAENRGLIERMAAQMPRPRDYAIPAAPEGPGGGVD